MIVKIDEQLFVTDHFGSPRHPVHVLQFVKLLSRKLGSGPLYVLVAWHPADGSLTGLGPDVRAVHDPLQYAHVLAESGPDKLSVRILAEPVDVEDSRRFREMPLHL